MKIYYTLTYDENQAIGNGNSITIGTDFISHDEIIKQSKHHSNQIGKKFKYTSHHYLWSEWLENEYDDEIINSGCVEELL